MIIDVSQALKEPGKVFPFALEEEWEDIEFYGDILHFSAPVHAEGDYFCMGENIVFQGKMSIQLELQCSRCLQKFSFPFLKDFAEEYSRKQDEEHSDVYHFAGDTVVLDEMLQDQLLLNFPLKILCSDTCKGLCPVCGTNLNRESCSCKREQEVESRHPFAALKHLVLDDDKEV
jgi:uncharacterized protein